MRTEGRKILSGVDHWLPWGAVCGWLRMSAWGRAVHCMAGQHCVHVGNNCRRKGVYVRFELPFPYTFNLHA